MTSTKLTKPLTDRAVILCFQKQTTKMRKATAVTQRWLCGALKPTDHSVPQQFAALPLSCSIPVACGLSEHLYGEKLPKGVFLEAAKGWSQTHHSPAATL